MPSILEQVAAIACLRWPRLSQRRAGARCLMRLLRVVQATLQHAMQKHRMLSNCLIGVLNWICQQCVSMFGDGSQRTLMGFCCEVSILLDRNRLAGKESPVSKLRFFIAPPYSKPNPSRLGFFTSGFPQAVRGFRRFCVCHRPRQASHKVPTYPPSLTFSGLCSQKIGQNFASRAHAETLS